MVQSKISRRMVLTGLGASVALPWLESGRLLGVEESKVPPKRFGFMFWGDGIHPAEWWTKGSGENLELGPVFDSLEDIKEQVNFIHGLKHPSNVVGGHAKGAAGMLTGHAPQGGRDIEGEVSLDQVLANAWQDETVLPSLVLACERPVSGFHESGYSMMYASHLSWSSPVSPVPSELYPALAFDSLFDSKGSKTHLSVLDHVREQLGDVARKVSFADRAKIDEYTASVREVEQRLAKMQKRNVEETADNAASPNAERPKDGIPNQLDEHAKLMCDIIALAFQTDRTRVSTLVMTNNLSGQIYPFLGLNVDHHNYSHSCHNEEFAKITRFWVEQYAYLVKKLHGMQEGDGTVLDNCCLMAANEQWTFHNGAKVPLLMAGSMGGNFDTGRTLDFDKADNDKMSSLYLTILERMGLGRESFGNSSQALTGI